MIAKNSLTSRSTRNAAAAVGIFLCQAASAENGFVFYGGSSFTRNSDLHLVQQGAGTDLTVQDVHWDADPFKLAPYYGLRFMHFFEKESNWGWALDFTH